MSKTLMLGSARLGSARRGAALALMLGGAPAIAADMPRKTLPVAMPAVSRTYTEDLHARRRVRPALQVVIG